MSSFNLQYIERLSQRFDLNEGVEVNRYSKKIKTERGHERKINALTVTKGDSILIDIDSNTEHAKQKIEKVLSQNGTERMVMNFEYETSRGWDDLSDEDGYDFRPGEMGKDDVDERVEIVYASLEEALSENGLEGFGEVVRSLVTVDTYEEQHDIEMDEDMPRVIRHASQLPDVDFTVYVDVVVSSDIKLPEDVVMSWSESLEAELGNMDDITGPTNDTYFNEKEVPMSKDIDVIIDNMKDVFSPQMLADKILEHIKSEGFTLPSGSVTTIENSLDQFENGMGVIMDLNKEIVRERLEALNYGMSLEYDDVSQEPTIEEPSRPALR